MTQLDNKIKYPEKNRINIDNIDNLKKHEEFIRNNNSISKTQQRFNSERGNVFIKEIIKIALS